MSKPGWSALTQEAQCLGYKVELVEYCESSDSPGFLGAGLGVCIYGKRIIRIRNALREADRCFVLTHELEHARNSAADRAIHHEIDRRHYERHLKRRQAISDYLYPPGRGVAARRRGGNREDERQHVLAGPTFGDILSADVMDEGAKRRRAERKQESEGDDDG